MSDTIAQVDTPNPAAMWTISALAERDAVSKQAASKKVRKLAADHGLVVERDGKDRIVKFNVVQFDMLRERFGDPAHAQARKEKPAKAAPSENSFEEARRQNAWLDAERSRLALDEAKGRLIVADTVREAIAAAGDAIAAVIDRLPNAADDLAAAVARDGGHGARVALTKEAARLRAEVAAALRNAQPGGATEQGGAQT